MIYNTIYPCLYRLFRNIYDVFNGAEKCAPTQPAVLTEKIDFSDPMLHDVGLKLEMNQ